MTTTGSKSNTKRKVIGTLVLVVGLSVGVFGTAKASQAFFLGTPSNMIFDATVGSVGSDSLTVYTTSSTPITLAITNRTVFAGRVELEDLAPGDAIKVIARRQGGELRAQVINRVNGVSGYGTAGDLVLVSRGTVQAKGADTVTVRINGIDTVFHVTASTRYFGTSFAGLAVGNTVLVIGNDTGSSATGFVARQIFR